MKEYNKREDKKPTTKEWFDYWRPCICGHLSHDHEFDSSLLPIFNLSMFNGLRGGIAWIDECEKCDCPRFKKGTVYDMKLVESCKSRYGYLWGYVP